MIDWKEMNGPRKNDGRAYTSMVFTPSALTNFSYVMNASDKLLDNYRQFLARFARSVHTV